MAALSQSSIVTRLNDRALRLCRAHVVYTEERADLAELRNAVFVATRRLAPNGEQVIGAFELLFADVLLALAAELACNGDKVAAYRQIVGVMIEPMRATAWRLIEAQRAGPQTTDHVPVKR